MSLMERFHHSNEHPRVPEQAQKPRTDLVETVAELIAGDIVAFDFLDKSARDTIKTVGDEERFAEVQESNDFTKDEMSLLRERVDARVAERRAPEPRTIH